MCAGPGAHPDDVDFHCGGTLAGQAASGRRVVILDLTGGELGSRGDAETRAREAAASANVLGAAERLNLDLGDTRIEDSPANRRRVVEVIRRLRPTVVLAHSWDDAHPDHVAAGRLVWSSAYAAGLANFPAEGVPYRPNAVLFFPALVPSTPSFVVDVTGSHETKLRAVRCFASQLGLDGIGGPSTPLTDRDFLPALESRARYFGSLIGRTFGEPFRAAQAVPMSDPVSHYERFPQSYALAPEDTP